ncbi:monofunctional biosynthetic peptidoglycan transglycosylase [Rasiella sp. SM2506]|uniref:monofunctional biosynthetic peptidoglycan transglycosylase n=1 Tax=Rasiella sp. SM2506 TaxID=3423914 RepID=UPI003D790F44
MIKKLLKFLFKALLWFLGITILWVLLYKYVPVYYTPLMAIRYFEAEGDFETKHQWVPISEIAPELQLAVICAEDQKFVKHNGFDVKSIEKAYENNQKGKKLRGASSISQQTAKNVFLWPDRSWLRKGLETYFTFLIELLWDKERILEVYLNSIEMGDGVYGAEAASKFWFNKSARNLQQYEAAAIAAILPNPRNYRANPSSAYIQKRKEWIVRQMRFYGTFTLEKLPKNDR